MINEEVEALTKKVFRLEVAQLGLQVALEAQQQSLTTMQDQLIDALKLLRDSLNAKRKQAATEADARDREW